MDDFMNEAYNDLFTATPCPTQQELLDYVQGKLSAEKQHEIELHLSDCELCSDAVEGLNAFEKKEIIPVYLRQMKWQMLRKLHSKKQAKNQMDTYIQLAIVVIVILFILLACFWTYHFVSHSGR